MENNKNQYIPITEMIKWWRMNGNFNVSHYTLYLQAKASIK